MQAEMKFVFEAPLATFIVSFLLMWLSSHIGVRYRKRMMKLDEGLSQDLDLIVAATLTLLGLIIGFSFSMATNRYDQRKNYEEAEANAIGTEYVRADLLPPDAAARVHVLLKQYLDERVNFYKVRRADVLQQVNMRTGKLQNDLWAAVRAPAGVQPTPIMALAVSGMNDVLNSQGYTQAIWWNRIPIGAWLLMLIIALCANLMMGYASHRPEGGSFRLLFLPFILASAFFLIADIDSPRKGVIRVSPQNLISLQQSWKGQ